jgi:predicted porin
LQIEGDFLTLPSLFTANIVLNNKTTLDEPGLMNYAPFPSMGVPQSDFIYGEPYDSENSAYSLSYEFYPTPALGLKLAYLHLDDKGPHTYEPDKIDAKDKDAYSVGFDYSLRQNIAFSMEYSWIRPSREDIQDYSDLLAVMTVAF